MHCDARSGRRLRRRLRATVLVGAGGEDRGERGESASSAAHRRRGEAHHADGQPAHAIVFACTSRCTSRHTHNTTTDPLEQQAHRSVSSHSSDHQRVSPRPAVSDPAPIRSMAHPIDSGGDDSRNSHSSSQWRKGELAPPSSGWGHLQPADGDGGGPSVSLLCQPDTLLTRPYLSARTAGDMGEEGPPQRDESHSAGAAAAAAAAVAAIAAVPLPQPLLPSAEVRQARATAGFVDRVIAFTHSDAGLLCLTRWSTALLIPLYLTARTGASRSKACAPCGLCAWINRPHTNMRPTAWHKVRHARAHPAAMQT